MCKHTGNPDKICTECADRDALRVQVNDLAMLTRRLVYALRKANPGHALSNQAMDYLTRHNLQGSPLRGE